MTSSKRMAGLIGPTLVAITTSEMMHPHIWDAMIAPVTYQAGALVFVAGLAIVRVHNRWTRSWTVLVTLVGWLAVFGGLFRMFAPELAQRSAQNISAVFAVQIGLLAIGIVLTFNGYRRVGQKAVGS